MKFCKQWLKDNPSELKDGFYTDENILVEVSDDKDFSNSELCYLSIYSTKFNTPFIKTWMNGETAKECEYNKYCTTYWNYCRLPGEKEKIELTVEELIEKAGYSIDDVRIK